MADYYSLLAKAVAGLPNSTPDQRRAIYERARKALFGQLRSLDPPVPEPVIEREARALEEAIARLEIELSPDVRETAPPIGKTEPETVEPVPETPPPTPPEPNPSPESTEPGRGFTEPSPPEPETPEPPRSRQDNAGGIETVEVGRASEPVAESISAPPDIAAQSVSPAAAGAPGLARKEARRPAVPLPRRKNPLPKRLWIVGAVVAGVVIAVMALAYALRDRPEDVVRPSTMSLPQGEGDANGKIADRIGSGEAKPIEPPATPFVKPEETAKASAPQMEPPAAVARRAALLVEAPEEQSKVKVHLGTVVWRIENINNGPGEPLGLAVRAEVDIPEEKLQALLTFQKNDDGTLPASHTMKLRFVVPPGAPLGTVQRINVPHMRREDAQNGDPLNGVPVPIMENSFLVGFTKGPAEATNLDLVRSREWIDVPMVFANGKIAKLTFEKGTSGQRAIEDALAVWKAQ
jgi:hypothetical protein